eukprot:gnl/Dysnectes_brevis/5865_a8717_421.p1 GENE.gnl/Dysnectes_brevis/5865_a8717_421~~gnl/Dysnectes_brevis/5865_a8717_421.p1  ORF type:complete len:511 (-),score=180.68 gnl/Dysnectes_brevis/5865_a8717_421:288-1820(-)
MSEPTPDPQSQDIVQAPTQPDEHLQSSTTKQKASILSDTDLTYAEIREKRRVDDNLKLRREHSLFKQMQQVDTKIYESFAEKKARLDREEQELKHKIQSEKEAALAAAEAERTQQAIQRQKQQELDLQRAKAAELAEQQYQTSALAGIRESIAKAQQADTDIADRIAADRSARISLRAEEEHSKQERRAAAQALARKRASNLALVETRHAEEAAEYSRRMGAAKTAAHEAEEARAESKRLWLLERATLKEERRNKRVTAQSQTAELAERRAESIRARNLKRQLAEVARIEELQQAAAAEKAAFERRRAAELESAAQSKSAAHAESERAAAMRNAFAAKRMSRWDEEQRELSAASAQYAERLRREKAERLGTEQARLAKHQQLISSEQAKIAQRREALRKKEAEEQRVQSLRADRISVLSTEWSQREVARIRRLQAEDAEKKRQIEAARAIRAQRRIKEREASMKAIVEKERRWLESEAAREERIRLRELRLVQEFIPLPAHGKETGDQDS